MDQKGWAKHILRRIGLEVSMSNPRNNVVRNAVWHCQHDAIDLCIDVGANTGQFGVEMREAGYRGEILSFEPLTDAHAKLRATAVRYGNWTIADRMALGRTVGEIEINIANNSASSSVLPMLENHVRNAPDARYVGRETVRLMTLDAYWVQYQMATRYRRVFLKLDTQGYEMEVLAGAQAVMPFVGLLLSELSIVPLYEKGPSLGSVYSAIEAHGLSCIYLNRGFYDEERQAMLQVDGLFSRM